MREASKPTMRRDSHERVGSIEIRWNDGDPDDVVAPWPSREAFPPVAVHVERMNDGDVWMEIVDGDKKVSAIFWFRAVRKGVLEWTSHERRDYSR